MTQFDPISDATPADLESLKGAELTTVTVWKFGVSLKFGDELGTLTVESNAEFRSQGRTELYNQELIVAFGARVLSLVGRCVVDVARGEDKTLSLDFDEGTRLTIRPDVSGYESYQLDFAGRLMIG